MIAYEEKATLPGRQCGINQKQNYITRLSAGGQRLSDTGMIEFSPGISGTAAMAQLGGTALQHTQSPEFSVATISQIVGCILNTRQYFPQWGECEPVAHTLFLRTSLGCVQILLLCSPVLGRSNIECRGQRNFAPADFIQDFGSSFAFWRWRSLISPFAAVTRNPAVLSPSCLKSSISSITSWGIRTVVICDFAFFAPVAITETPYVRCISVYAKKIKEKGLKCISLWASLNIKGDIHLSSAKPGSARNTNRASNHRR
ncbi:hypothetical protein HV142_04375 [Citrobacter sp. RHBSTW-00271]|nr:hypothetical protein [Citrobacter sp. RHBSTW-00271]